MYQPLADIERDLNETKSLSGVRRLSITRTMTFDYSICLYNVTTATESTVSPDLGEMEKGTGKTSKRRADLQTGLRNPVELEVVRFHVKVKASWLQAARFILYADGFYYYYYYYCAILRGFTGTFGESEFVRHFCENCCPPVVLDWILNMI